MRTVPRSGDLRLTGVEGWTSSPVKRLIVLANLLCDIASLGFASVALLESAVGSLVAAYMHNRRLLCLLDLVYEAMRGRPQHGILRLSRNLRVELLMAAALLPFARTDLRLAAPASLWMVDASLRKIAAVSAALPPIIGKELVRHTCRKGRWARLLAPSQRWLRQHALLSPDEELPEGGAEPGSALWEELVPAMNFVERAVVPARRGEHINISEVKSWALAEAECAAEAPDSRAIIGTDSQVGLAVVVKGRSASPKINCQLQTMLPTVLGANIMSHGFWLGSALNPCDDPTRDLPVRPASCPLPSWWGPALENDFTELDRVLEVFRLTDPPPSLLELVPPEPSCLPSRRALRRERAANRSKGERAEEHSSEHLVIADRLAQAELDANCSSAPPSKMDTSCSSQQQQPQQQHQRHQAYVAPAPCGAASQFIGYDRLPGPRELEDGAVFQSPVAPDGTVPLLPGKGDFQADVELRGPVAAHTCSLRQPATPLPQPGSLSPEGPPLMITESWERAHPVLASIPSQRFLTAARKPAGWRPSTPGYVDLYSGSKRAAYAALRRGAPWALCFELRDDPAGQDLQLPSVRILIESLLAEGSVAALGAGPVCSSFSQAITPAVRNREFPSGMPGMRASMRAKVRLGNSMATWVAKLARLCLSLGIPFWVENPRFSWLWRLRVWRRLAARVGGWTVDYCRFGTPWRKSTFFCTNLEISGACTGCRCGARHLVLRGQGPGSVPWTRIAEPYPAGVADVLGLAVCRGAGWRPSRAALDLDALAASASQACAETGPALRARYGLRGRRIGEASHPGPQRRRLLHLPCSLSRLVAVLLFTLATPAAAMPRPALPRDRPPLTGASRHTMKTLNLHASSLDAFTAWLIRQGLQSSLDLLAAAPTFLDECLRAYGMELYEADEPNYKYIYTITGIQAKFLYMKRALHASWDFALLWDQLEPTQHRRPIPEAVFKAMVSLALLWGWRRLAAVLVLTFRAVLRPVEGYLALRKYLVLPRDTLQPEAQELYLSIPRPKTRNRGARQQYARMSGASEVAFVNDVFGDFGPDERLLDIAASTFRRRWDLLTNALGLERDTFIPGGLRGGGAVAHFRAHNDISLLMWQMRVKDQNTLGHYLQEVTTLTSLTELPSATREKIRVASALYEIMLAPATSPATPR